MTADGAVAGFDHVQVAAPPGSEEAARAFYGGVLGLEEIEKPPVLAARGGCWFRVGAHELHLGIEDSFAPARKAHPAIRIASVEALERLAARLEDAGYAVERPDPAEIPGRDRFHVCDPFGNRLELLC